MCVLSLAVVNIDTAEQGILAHADRYPSERDIHKMTAQTLYLGQFGTRRLLAVGRMKTSQHAAVTQFRNC